jgi:predicted  nucleic acid-binding Zn-ribbon protein
VTRISNLFRLQTLDSQIDSHQARLSEIEASLKQHPELDRARTEEEDARVRLEEAKKDLRRTEEETRGQQQRISETDKTLYGGSVTNPKELQDLQEESAALRRYLSVLEERQLQSMIRSEESEKAVAAAQAAREEQERLRAAQDEKLLAEQTLLQTTLETIGYQREAAVSAVTAEDLERYSTLRRSKHGMAVVRFESGACGACGVAPSSARIDSARSGQEIIQCGNCGRILYMG